MPSGPTDTEEELEVHVLAKAKVDALMQTTLLSSVSELPKALV